MPRDSRPGLSDLPNARTRAIARSFYEQLRREDFTPNQVVGLATDLLDLVHADIDRPPTAPAAK